MSKTSYVLRARDSSLNLIGEVVDWSKLTIVKVFNGVGQATLAMNADDPMAPYLATPGYGLVIARYITDDNGVLTHFDESFFSGSSWEPQRDNQNGQKTLTVVFYDDLLKVATRDAYPVTNYPYTTQILSESGLVRFYELQETSGTTAHDAKSSVSMTYTNSPTLGVAQTGLDDAATCVQFASASTQYATTTTMTGMPTGNSAFTIEGWFLDTSFPNSINEHAAFGKAAASSCVQIYTDASGNYHAGWDGGNIAWGSAVTAGTWHYVVYTYDGTTAKLYVDNGTPVTGTPGTLTLPSSAAEVTIGAFPVTHGNLFNGKALYVAFYNVALSATQISTHYHIGLSRFAYGTGSDTSTGDAETVIQHFVNGNAGPGAVAARAQPNFVLGTNNHNGSTITGVGTFDRLISRDGTGLLQRLALASANAGSPIGYEVTQSGGTLTFACYAPTDRTTTCIFSDDLGNLGDFSYSVKGPDWEAGGNALVVGGQGTGTSRSYYMVTDTGSVGAWGRVEQFIDQSNTTDLTSLANAAAAAIVALKDTSSLTLNLAPQSALVYGIDFELGDSVTYVVDGAYLQDIVRQVQIDLDPSTGEVVTPAVGTPNTAALMGAYAAYIQRTQAAIAAIRNRVANVERRAN